MAESDVRPAHNPLVPLVVLGSALTLIHAGSSYGVSHPTSFQPGWALSWVLSLGLIAANLAMARSSKSPIALGAAMLLSGAAFFSTTREYFENFLDLPLVPTGLFLILVTVALILRRFVVGGLAVVLVALILIPARSQPNLGDRLIRKGDLVFVAARRDSDGHRYVLRSASGRNIRQAYDWSRTELAGSIGWLLPVRYVHASYDKGFQGHDPSTVELVVSAPMADWIKSWDGRLTVMEWPRTPQAEVIVPLDPTTKPLAFRASSGSFRIESATARKEGADSAKESGLDLRISYTAGGYDYYFRVLDDRRTEYKATLSGNIETDGRAHLVVLTIAPIPTRPVRLQVNEHDYMEEGETIFDLQDLPFR